MNFPLKEICDYIIKEVQEKSIFNGFQYIVAFLDVQKKFDLKMDKDIIYLIYEELSFRDEISDIQIDNIGFDIVLYTDYAPNYDKEDYIK